jgi:hypothetical protein
MLLAIRLEAIDWVCWAWSWRSRASLALLSK